MRLGILENGHRLTQKIVFKFMKFKMGHVPGPMLTLTYRRNWFGAKFFDCLEDGLRRTSEWTTAEAELFAAFVSNLNRCGY